MDTTADMTIRCDPQEQILMVHRIDPIRHAANVAWGYYANEDMRPMNTISERKGGSGVFKKISLRVTMKLPSAA